ncbi:hypothetical protein HCR_15680 [Hydrogenimonas cancrithermarum]|uniref:Uncharacterized protein n=1 Tax=Hydrogenimonas cancrithermarum TaxID=2993563 RepID=A0ABM8FLL3_9BACT|nr:hypothetical protein HCR_15680 [Hydrogenimonas cancrithermarum]
MKPIKLVAPNYLQSKIKSFGFSSGSEVLPKSKRGSQNLIVYLISINSVVSSFIEGLIVNDNAAF